jgi:hypothetical protein
MRTLLVTSLLLLSAACEARSWGADIYPDRNNLSDSRFIGTFDSLEACQEAALTALRDMDATDSGDYECGQN